MHAFLKRPRRPIPAWAWLSLAAVVLAGCGTADPVAYSGIASSAQLAPNPQDDTGHMPFRYATPVDWRSYNRMIIDPIAIYRARTRSSETCPRRTRPTWPTPCRPRSWRS